ncbi:S8 family serine peptidase [Sphingomonas sp.]|jgi:subtilisin family serine protease|uniref:S8 family serine peptidase n=1 Tax=Sphingomonas sp. TaxID=28214 RepID=UPI002DEDFE59|nr:S8 family serine peptidase [Sphingomonas sp.]HEV2568216.1 S8 family serine peptidase [Sphingomonas sp.]
MPRFTAGRVERFDVLTTRTFSEVTEELSLTPFAERVAAAATVTVDAISNDTDYLAGKMWGMYGDKTTPVNIYGSQAGEAWAAGHVGSMKVAIGVIDSGVDYTHSDLYSNIWLNQGEIPFAMRGLLVDTDQDSVITFRDLNSVVNGGFVTDLNLNGRIDGGDLLKDARWANGVDEAGNGYVDDLIGWDFANEDNDPYDDQGHGTHVAGTIGARGGDGIGVAGVAWNTQIVALKFMDSTGSGYSDAAARAIDYFTTAKSSNYGIDFAATNNSWGGGGYTQQLQDAINRAAKADILFVASAGNGGSDGLGDNNDVIGYYPANYSTQAAAGFDAVISVAAIASNGTLAGFSNYGAATVDIGAPGVGIYSTLKGGGWGYMSGTSMAAPHVAGAIALFSAANPGYSAAQIRAELLSSGAATASLAGKTVTGKRLDVAEFVAVNAPAPSPTPTPAPTPTPSPSPTTLYGTVGNDTVRGTSASETIYGIAASDAKLGTGARDYLYGGGGADVFVLGDARGLFYDDKLAASNGRADWVMIRDFGADDRIQLSGAASNYILRTETLSGIAGTSIFRDDNGNQKYDSYDEFVGHVSGSAVAQALTKDYLVFSGATPVPTPSPTPTIYGTSYNDVLNGTAASEKILGIASADTALGTGTRDTVYGRGGADLFVLGDARGLFYDDHLANSGGRGDHLLIRDFDTDDRIQLTGDISDYIIRTETISGITGTSIFLDSNADARWDGYDEFIAHVAGPTAPALLTPDYFVFV